MVQHGWKPKRTIVLAFWDGEEFGLVGSTEWAEKHEAELDAKLAVYINSDSNGKGSLNASGSHALEQFVTEVARDIKDPVSGKSVLESRRPRRNADPPADNSGAFRLGPLGAGSDYVAFIDHVGASSLNLGFGGDGGGGVYHSVYDSFYWYTHFNDGDFAYGKTLAQVVAVSLMRLGDAPVLPYEFGALARTVRGYTEEIQKQASTSQKTVDFHEVNTQIARLEANAKSYDEAFTAAEKRLAQAPPEKLAKLNETLYRAERALLLAKGLPGRPWYRHQLYAPGMYTGYGAKTLPGVREAVDAGRWDEANDRTKDVAQALGNFNAQVQEATRLLHAFEE
jgi:N-acetylated-alpha-linked acidic dipeptidase